MSTKNFFGGYSLGDDLKKALIISDEEYERKYGERDKKDRTYYLNVNGDSGVHQAMVPINTFSININIDSDTSKDNLKYIFDRIERIFK